MIKKQKDKTREGGGRRGWVDVNFNEGGWRGTCVCWGIFRKLSRVPMPTNRLGAVEPGVEYATKQKETSVYMLLHTQSELIA